jgi:peroxiredoxin
MRTEVISAVLAVFLIGCNSAVQNTGVTIKGSVDNKAGDMVWLQELKKGGFDNIDSTSIGEDLTFQFSLEVQEDGFYRVNIFNRQIANVVLDGTENEITINADGKDPRGKLEIAGSESIRLMRQMDSLARKKQSDVQVLNNEAMAVRGNPNAAEVMTEIRDQYFMLMKKYDRLLKEKIAEGTPTLAGIYGLNYIEVEQHLDFADSLAAIYKEELPNHFLAQDFVTEVENYKKLAIGADAPEISLPTPDGDMLSLSSLKGNYVLVDFWAAWCRPCRMENPNVVRLYNKYSDENFEILGVSLDRKKEDWVKAIEQDGLTWKHVSDLKYFNSEAAQNYNIQAIPATYLIGPDGKIIDKNLRGEALAAKLEEIFGA